jgi:hypothetical protein
MRLLRLLQIRRRLTQRHAVESVRRLGGYVFYERGNELEGPAVLVRLLGRDFVDNVEFVDLSGTKADDQDSGIPARLKWSEVSTTQLY